MSNTVIRVEHLYKQYKLGVVSTRTISHDLNRWWHKVRNLEDPYLKVSIENDRTKKGSSDYVWALEDINFDVQQGDVLGIVGKNGAGKSTLLKILSKVTNPTKGQIKVKGRIASLLEVGTGFNPELTGKENIYLNGAILGMTKREITSKLDEIIDFSGVERYLDTPVKRYSSGMYVRLAFGVAAHLEPEILIIDEVLAVGDAEFQKKCLGKMKDVSTQGRTVLFVSHNMSAVNSLCTKGILLQHGKVIKTGTATEITDFYQKNAIGLNTSKSWEISSIYENVNPLSIRLIDKNHQKLEKVMVTDEFGVEITYLVKNDNYKPVPNVRFFGLGDEVAFVSANPEISPVNIKAGTYKSVVWIPANFLNEGPYRIGLSISTLAPLVIHFNDNDCINIDVIDDLNAITRNEYKGKMNGFVRPLLKWENSKTQ